VPARRAAADKLAKDRGKNSWRDKACDRAGICVIPQISTNDVDAFRAFHADLIRVRKSFVQALDR
jgi:hypothetical protein